MNRRAFQLLRKVLAAPWICFVDIVFIPQQQQKCYNNVTFDVFFFQTVAKTILANITFTSLAFVSFFADAFEAI